MSRSHIPLGPLIAGAAMAGALTQRQTSSGRVVTGPAAWDELYHVVKITHAATTGRSGRSQQPIFTLVAGASGIATAKAEARRLTAKAKDGCRYAAYPAENSPAAQKKRKAKGGKRKKR